MKKGKIRDFAWELILLALLLILWIVFEWKDTVRDAVLVALGRKAKNVFSFSKMVSGMQVYMLYSFMALGMALILGMGDIDISVGASATLSAAVMGVLYRTLLSCGMNPGLAFAFAICACLVTGALCGLFNGYLITRFRELFPMIVTLGTMLFYRGLCYLVLGGNTLRFEDDATWAQLKALYNNKVLIGGLNVPTIIFWFLGFAVVFYVFLHKSTAGRRLFAIGENRVAARYSGIRVDRLELAMFVVCGFMAAVSSLFYVGSASATVRADAMTGYEMYAIAVAVLGGFSTGGGKGNILGVVLSVVLFGVLKKGLGTLFGFPDSVINLAVGIVLILSSLLPNLCEMLAAKIRMDRQKKSGKEGAEND